jgi:hypothetical protein
MDPREAAKSDQRKHGGTPIPVKKIKPEPKMPWQKPSKHLPYSNPFYKFGININIFFICSRTNQIIKNTIT